MKQRLSIIKYFYANRVAAGCNMKRTLKRTIPWLIYITSTGINRCIDTSSVGLCQMSSTTGNGVRVQYQRKSNYPNRMEFNSSSSSVGTTPREQRKKTVKRTVDGGELKWLNRKRKRHPSLWPLTRFPPPSFASPFLLRYAGRFHIYFNTPHVPGYSTLLQIEIV